MIDLKRCPTGRGSFRNNYRISWRAPETALSKKVELWHFAEQMSVLI
jgi:hypothetical protein